MNIKLTRVIFIVSMIILLEGCGKQKAYRNDALSKKVVAISLFKCNCDPLVKEAVQDTFLDVFFKYTNAKLVKGKSGDITIVGILTMDKGYTAQSKSSVYGGGSSAYVGVGGGSSGSSATGTYVTGITMQAYKKGELIATHSVGQNLGRGNMISAVTLSQQGARYLLKALVRQNEIGRK